MERKKRNPKLSIIIKSRNVKLVFSSLSYWHQSWPRIPAFLLISSIVPLQASLSSSAKREVSPTIEVSGKVYMVSPQRLVYRNQSIIRNYHPTIWWVWLPSYVPSEKLNAPIALGFRPAHCLYVWSRAWPRLTPARRHSHSLEGHIRFSSL